MERPCRTGSADGHLDRPLLKMESGCITQCKTKELKDQVVSLLDAIRTGHMPPAKFPLVTRELFQAYMDMEEEMVARAEVDALAREEQKAALEMGL